MDAIQRQRQAAQNYGYLHNSDQLRVVDEGPGAIELLPANPGLLYVPYYTPLLCIHGHGPASLWVAQSPSTPGLGLGLSPPGVGEVPGLGGLTIVFREQSTLGTLLGESGSYVHPYEARAPVVENRAERHDLHEYRRFEYHDENRREEHHEERRR